MITLSYRRHPGLAAGLLGVVLLGVAAPSAPAAGATPHSVTNETGDLGWSDPGWSPPAADAFPADFAWEPTFHGPGFDDNALSTVVWDDGGGPALYAGGLFRTAGGQVVNRIARWDGDAWSPLAGPAGTGVDGPVSALTVYDGDLVAGGSFVQAGGVTVNGVARWDGTQWSPLGSGVDRPQVQALTAYDGDLIAAGSFTRAGGVIANRVARWDGTQWSPLGPGVDGGTVFSLTEFRGDLIAAGSFRNVGGVPMNRIARWDGTGWSPLGGGLLGGLGTTVHALTGFGGDLIAGGTFPQAGDGVVVNRVARWDGADWHPLTGSSGTGTNGRVRALTVLGDTLVAGGSFTDAGGMLVNRVARWTGSEWTALAGPGPAGVDGESVHALTVGPDGALVAAGAFARAGGVPVNRIARWDGDRWSEFPEASPAGLSGDVQALVVYDGDLVAGGRFVQAGGQTVSHVARWDGAEWSPLGSLVGQFPGFGVNGFVWSLAVYQGDLIVGGDLSRAGSRPVNHIARWDGETWSPLAGPSGTGTDDAVRALVVHDGDLIAGGEFTEAGGESASRVARWDGAEWSPLGSGLTSTRPIPVQDLAVYDGDLVTAGQFTEAGGEPVNNIARWDGAAWSPLAGPEGDGVNQRVQALTVYEGALVAGGGFTQAGGVPANWLARWDGAAWSALPDELSGGCCSPFVRSLTTFDGALVAGGVFEQAGGETVNQIAAWDGAAWSPLAGPDGTGMDGGISERFLGNPQTSVWALTSWAAGGAPAPGALVAGGSFSLTGGVPNWGVARYRQVEPEPAPVIEVTPDTLPFTQGEGEVAGQALTIGNAGDAALQWRIDQAETACDSPVDVPWLEVDPAAGTVPAGGSTEVTVTVDSTGLAPGAYRARLCVGSDDPATPLVEVPVPVTVTEPEPVVCDETITGVHPGPLTVAEGVTCLAAGAQVLGEVNVQDGAGLVAAAAVIQGPLSAIGAATVDVAFSQITGPVLVLGATGEVSLFGSQVTGSVSLVSNTTGTPATVSGNTVIGTLSCFGNQPAPTDHGLPNTAIGGTFGQCAEL